MFTRRLSRRLFTMILAVGLPVALLTVADPTWAKAIGVDVWNVPALEQEAQEAYEQNDQMTATAESLNRRMEVKEALIRDLIEGRATLAEVTAQFYELNSPYPQYMTAIRANFPGRTDEEKMAHNVIYYALPRATPEQREALKTRLDAELQQMLIGSAGR